MSQPPQVLPQSKPGYDDETGAESMSPKLIRSPKGKEPQQPSPSATREKEIISILLKDRDDYEGILGVAGSDDYEQKMLAYDEKSKLVHPEKNKDRAKDKDFMEKSKYAFKLLYDAKEKLINPREQEIFTILSKEKNDYQGILGVKRSDNDKKKLTVYKKKAMLVHPDKNMDRQDDKGFMKQSDRAMKLLSNAVRNLVDKTTEVPVDPLQPGEEFHPSRYAESSDESDNEYSDTSQDEASGGTRTIFYPRANVLIKNLKDDPNDEDAYERIRRLNDEIKRHLEEESPDEMDDGITIDVEAFREKYRAINSYAGSLRRNPMDEAARRKAETLIDELNDFIAKNRYPKSWAISIPYFAKSSELHTSTPPNFPRTRLGEVICAHRTWVTGYKEDGSPKNAYLIAILPNDNIPIGEIWSGTAIGEEAKNSYLASNMAEHIWKPDKRELGELKTRFKKVLRVFVQPSSKKETWVSILLGPRSSTDPPEETRVITRSNLIAFRKRADAFNDIADVYKKQGKDVPAHIAKTEPRQQRLAKNALQDTSNYANQSYSTMENARALKDLLLESGVNVQKRQNLEMGETAALVNAMLREQQNKNGHKSQHAFAQHGGSATNTNQDLRVEALESRIDELTAAVKEIAVGMRAREATG